MKKLGYKLAQSQIRDVQSRFFATARKVPQSWGVGVKREPLSRVSMFYITTEKGGNK